MTPLPMVLGLTVCEKVIVEEGTKNVSLVSTFTKLFVEEFPSPPQRFAIYTVLTNAVGDATIELTVTRLDSDEEVYSLRRPLRFPDRLAEVRVLYRLREVMFPAAGWYQFTLYLDGEWLTQRRLQVVERQQGS